MTKKPYSIYQDKFKRWWVFGPNEVGDERAKQLDNVPAAVAYTEGVWSDIRGPYANEKGAKEAAEDLSRTLPE